MLEVKNVTKRVKGRSLLNHLSFSVYKNEICGFVGPNGSGKTTLIRTIMGLIKPNEGEVLINGVSVQKNREEALQYVGAIVESPIFFPYMSGRKNLRNLGRITMNSGGENLERKVEQVLKIVGLENRADDKVGTYSLGMKQRLGIAQALLVEFNTVNQLESFSFQLLLNEVNLQSFFSKKIEEYEYIAKKKEIEWDVMFENDDAIYSLVFDQERISQVMDNIVMNGVRFTPEEGKILVKVSVQHDGFQFHVYDSGTGFQPGDVQKVFRRFYQEDKSRSSSKEHSGLGLYIAKSIVEKHGGNIFAENSSVCGGAHVWFRIPSA